jgi:hypothetical protein
MARSVIDGVTRLAQMKEHTRGQLEALNMEWNRIYDLALGELDEIGKGIDDIAAMLGIIEPPMPMLPPRVPTGPQPSFRVVDGPAADDLDRFQP